jgi:hypothetical protein
MGRPDDTTADLSQLLADLRAQKRRVAAILAADRPCAATAPSGGSDRRRRPARVLVAPILDAQRQRRQTPMTDHDDTPRPLLEAARPAGSGFEVLDTPIVREMRELLANGRASSPTDAARQVAHTARGASPEAIVDRLVRLHARLFPVIPGSHGGRESDSSDDMSTARPHAAKPDLAARVAVLEATVAALTTRAQESDLMLAQVIEDRTELVRELIEMREAANEHRDVLTRYVGLTELRLAQNGLPRTRTVSKH